MATGTLTQRLGRDDYSSAEKTILEHFFTNTDKNVYCPTAHMPFPVWAFLVGQYSRSPVTMRDRFLEVFDQMERKVTRKEWPREKFVSKEAAAKAISSSRYGVLDYFFETAETFLSKWGVRFGHTSLRDADKFRVAIEGVSQLATNFIELPDPELGDYQEKSTRYISFSKEDVVMPSRLSNSQFGLGIAQNNDALMDSYVRLTPAVKEWLTDNVVDKKQFKTKAAYVRTLNAATFDIMRYWLPQGLTTSLGATWPLRVASTHISQMLSHPLEEFNLLGEALLEEGKKVSPGLMKHVEPNSYFGETVPALYALCDELLSAPENRFVRGDQDVQRVKLLSHTPDLENLLLTGIMYEHAQGRSWEAIHEEVSLFNDEQRELVFKEYASRRGKHDELLLRGTKLGRFLFEFVMDNGAWRDVKRQRVGTQLKQDITACLGYAYPQHVGEAPGLCNVKHEYNSLMGQTTDLFNAVVQKFPREASYIPAMGHLGRSLYEFHPRQGQYVVELRTPEAGHHSYREIFREVHREISKVLPRFAKYIRAVMDDDSIGRQKTEERDEAKAQKYLEQDRKSSE